MSELSSSNKQKSDLNKVVSRGENAGDNFQSNGRGPNNQRRQWDQNRVNNNNQRRAWGNNNYQNNGNNMNRRPGGYQNNYNQNNYNRGGYRRNDDQRVSNQRNQGGYRNYNNNYNQGNYNNYNNPRGQMRGGPRKFVPNKGKFNDPALKTEFDFEKSNQQFLDLVDKLDELNVSTNGEKSGSEDRDEARTELSKAADKVDEDGNFYDKTKSFFDNISCEAIERTKGNQKRFDWKQERKLNAETFGIKINFRQHDGTFRRGPGLSFNRNPNHQTRRYNNPQQQPRNQAPRTSSS